MKKTLTINIGHSIFNIEEDAYGSARQARLRSDPGRRGLRRPRSAERQPRPRAPWPRGCARPRSRLAR